MKNPMIMALLCALLQFVQLGQATPSLYDGFVDPAMEYGPRTWWHWINEVVSKDGITKDLEAMKEMGYKGVHMVNLPQGGAHEPGPDVFGSDSWWSKVEHAGKECERLGLELSFGSCVGWVAGGPWMPAELSMQDLVWRHAYVKGPLKGRVQLPQPTKNRDYYRDVAVLAYPSLPGEATALSSVVKSVTCAELPHVDWTAAIDGDAESFVSLPHWKKEEVSRILIFEFHQPEMVRGLSLQLQEDSSNRLFKMWTSNDGTNWQYAVNAHRWMVHFDPRREEFIEGFSERSARFVKLEILAPTPGVPMKLFEANFLSARLNQIHTKAGRQRTQPPISNPSQQKVSPEQLVKMGTILDLSDRLNPDGTLAVDLPAGEWTILRFGHTSNGNEIHPSSKHTSGLETDKFSVEALHHHFEHGVVDPMFERMGSLVGNTLAEMNIDSWEANCQTWTKKFPEEFEARRDYDLTKWLVAMTGRIVNSVDETERFLWDYRRTIGDLLADNFYGAFGAYIRKHGLKLSAEAPGIGIPIQCDQIQVQGLMDIPQGEFWLGGGEPDPRFPQWPGGQDNTKEAAVAAHVYGKEIVSCEAFTSFAHHDGFTQYPHILKPVGDRQFCKGMNEIVFHRYVHQPDERVPGVGLGQFGLNLERTTTWWNPGKAWITYLRRCQYMLRQGRFFADVCYFYGEDVPGSAWYYATRALDPRQKMKPVLPKGYDYDVCDRISFDRMTVENGEVVLPSGMRYAYLVLPEHARYTPAALEKVYELVTAGATVIGPRPARCPSLTDFPNADQRIQELAAKIWPEGKGPAERRVGKGRVIVGKNFETILAADSLQPDFQSGDDNVWYIHRRVGSDELYFVAYQEDQEKDLTLSFRVTGMVPEVWNPVTGEKTALASYTDNGTLTTLSLKMDHYGSRFVVFRPAAAQEVITQLTRDGQPVVLDGNGLEFVVWENGRYAAALKTGGQEEVVVSGLPDATVADGEWTVSFEKERGAPSGLVAFGVLTSWTEFAEEGIKYFSGTATYTKAINVETSRFEEGRRVWLDLGEVANLAEVSVNGQNLGVLWKAPFRVDITDAAKPGANVLEVKVTNCWKNRILGDWKLPEDQRITWTLYPFYHDEKDAPLMPSGLLGPVRLLSSAGINLAP